MSIASTERQLGRRRFKQAETVSLSKNSRRHWVNVFLAPSFYAIGSCDTLYNLKHQEHTLDGRKWLTVSVELSVCIRERPVFGGPSSKALVDYQRDPLSLKKIYLPPSFRTRALRPRPCPSNYRPPKLLCDDPGAPTGILFGAKLWKHRPARERDAVASHRPGQACSRGPLYSIYSTAAINLSQCLRGRGLRRPFFWCDRDHDLKDLDAFV